MYKLVSFDVNGVLTPDLTMVEFAKIAGNYNRAIKILNLQTSGKKSIKETFGELGKLTRNISLKKAIEYSLNMPLHQGAKELIMELNDKNIAMALNTTGYSVIMHVLNMRLKTDKMPFKFIACNNLIFSKNGKQINNFELKNLIDLYFKNKNSKGLDNINPNGVIELIIKDEREKANFIKKWAKSMKIKLSEVVHIGDSMGDSHALKFVAESNGLGVAFNPNKALLDFIKKLKPSISKNIAVVRNDLRNVIPYLL